MLILWIVVLFAVKWLGDVWNGVVGNGSAR
jgi:hypothetical protein